MSADDKKFWTFDAYIELSLRFAEAKTDIADLQRTVTHLQEANTREVKRRRHAEQVLAEVRVLLHDVIGFSSRSIDQLNAIKLRLLNAADRIEKGDFE